MTGVLALTALAVGSNLGGLHASELHPKLIVIGLAVVFALLGLVTARSIANQVARAASHANPHPGRGVAVVLFEVELALEGVVDGLDDLPQRLEERGLCPGRLSLASGRSSCSPVSVRVVSNSRP